MSDARSGTPDAVAGTADPADYETSPERERVLAALGAALAAGGVPCLEGPTGAGKTVLLQVLARRLSDRFAALYLPYPMLSCEELCALAIGLLGRPAAEHPEAALLRIAAETAARGRPLLLLIDDAGSLPADSARGLAALRADSRGSLHLALAGIGGAALQEAAAAFGSTLRRVGLDDAPAPQQRASPRLRDVLGDDLLDELGRAAAESARRTRGEAQRVATRAEITRAPRALGTAQEPEARPGSKSAVPAAGTAPTSEYRFVRGRVGAPPPAPSRQETVSPSRDAGAPPAQVDLALPPPSVPPRVPSAPTKRPLPAASPPRARERAPGEPAARRASSLPLVVVTMVAGVSAVLGFVLASRLQRGSGAIPSEPPPRAAGSAPARGAEVEQKIQPPLAADTRIVAAPAPAPTGATEDDVEISINAMPWAIVEVDGRALGETPLGGVRLSRGAHRFVARFPDGRVLDRTIEVDAAHRALVFE